MKNDIMFLMILLFVTFIIFWYLDNIQEKYCNCGSKNWNTGYDYEADYDKEITNGRIVAGTVYNSTPPGQNTGLGWIL